MTFTFYELVLATALGQLAGIAIVLVCVAIARLWEAVRRLNEIRVRERCAARVEGHKVSK